MPDVRHYRRGKGGWLCMKRGCLHLAAYWVRDGKSVNRYFCGWHTMRYWRANKGKVFANQLAGMADTMADTKSGLPYIITVLPQAVSKLTRSDKERLKRFSGW